MIAILMLLSLALYFEDNWLLYFCAALFFETKFHAAQVELSPPAGFAKVTGCPSYLVLSSPGFHFCRILVPHVQNNGCRCPRELSALTVFCILGFECVVCRQSDNVGIHEIPQSSTVKWSLYSPLFFLYPILL